MMAGPAGLCILFVKCMVEGNAFHFAVFNTDKRLLRLITVRPGYVCKFRYCSVFAGVAFHAFDRARFLTRIDTTQMTVDALLM